MRDTVRERPVVLLVEAPRTSGPGLADRLDSAGYTVWQAESGSDARQMLAEARRSRTEPDVIVLDRMLPDVDGLVLSAFLRAEIQVPIVLCSDRGASSTGRSLGYYAGVDGFGLQKVTSESYCDRPTWSPAPYNEIAYAARTGPGFDIKVVDLATRAAKQLTFGEGTNESPSYSPNGRHLAFVIPGNPLSHIVCWHLVIRAALDMLATGAIEFGLVEAPLGGTATLKGNARETWWPARISWEPEGVRFSPLKWQSSGDLTGIIGMDALIRVPAGIIAVQPGEVISARLIRAADM